MTIRPVTDLAELEKCVQLQREAWGLADIEVIPTRMLVTQNRVGGLVLGAFDGGRMVGFLNAMPGIRDGVPYWYSQMLAVAQDYRNRGIGSALKLAQRDHAQQRGIHLIEWTFDPLESKNAYLNVVKLGVIVRRYYVNLYGATASQVQQGLESDRVIAEWWIDKPRVRVEGDIRRIAIPSDIQALKKQNLKSAQDMQVRVREEFLRNFQDDYFVAGFQRSDQWSEYLFVAGAVRVHQTN
ncbi:MAG: acetyltransferase [Acidobacteria bacterium]|nr:MAG: acetyltransferase [Acidobacteriota bacterium]